MYWASTRLGYAHTLGAYAWRSLLNTGVIIPDGSDFPVERVNPLYSFHSAVSRQDEHDWPPGGWFPEQRMHGGKNYPFHKVAGCLDVELSDGTGDDAYLELLCRSLPDAIAASRADLVVYLAGADPHEGDRLGRLALSFEGLARRDAIVLQQTREVGLPVVLTIAGGYGRDIQDTVTIHARTARIAAEYSA